MVWEEEGMYYDLTIFVTSNVGIPCFIQQRSTMVGNPVNTVFILHRMCLYLHRIANLPNALPFEY